MAVKLINHTNWGYIVMIIQFLFNKIVSQNAKNILIYIFLVIYI